MPRTRHGRRGRPGARPVASVLLLMVLAGASATPLAQSTGTLSRTAAVSGPTAPATSSTVDGWVCEAVPQAPGPTSSGCGGDWGIAGAPVFLTSWSSLPSSHAIVWSTQPSSIVHVAETNTTSGGRFSLSYPGSGDYVVWTPNETGVSGNFATVSLSGSTSSANLIDWPYFAQGNATLVLPGYNSLSGYASNSNGAGCSGGSSGLCGVQVPLVAWTQDGAFYVNATDRLVFYSFANRTVRDLGPWTLLYDDVMNYEGIENTEWITADGSWVYEFGCSTSCSGSSPIEFYAVNVTTGLTASWTFKGITDSTDALNDNAEIQMIGEDGNDSLAALTLDENGNTVSPGLVYGYDLWNHTQWVLGVVPYFEANNNYWVGELNSFIDCEAHGATGDAVSQWLLAGPAPGTTLKEVGSSTYWGQTEVQNWIQWNGYNVTSHQISFSGGYTRGDAVDDVVYDMDYSATYGTYVLGSLAAGFYDASYGVSTVPPVFVALSSEHRSTAIASGWLTGQNNGETLFNNSIAINPFDSQFAVTNVTEAQPLWNSLSTAGYWGAATSDGAVEGYFYNASYGISPVSLVCSYACSVNGQNGAAKGTIYWNWPIGSPEFPFPASAPLAQPEAPGAPSDAMAVASAGNVTISWAPPASGGDPILNYTLLWGSGPSYGHTENLLATNRSFAIADVAPGTTIYFAVQAWNLHWSGPWAAGESHPGLSTYGAEFREAGLPSGTTWWVNSTSGGWSPSAATVAGPDGTSISVGPLVNGTYPFTVAESNRSWRASPNAGEVVIEGSAVDYPTLGFSPVNFSVTFRETGLGVGRSWWVNSSDGAWAPASAVVGLGSQTTITVSGLVNGSYAYAIAPGSDVDRCLDPSGRLTIAGTNATAPTAVFEAVTYSITFVEYGLPGGLAWWANSTSSAWAPASAEGLGSAGSEIVVEGLTNGSYGYRIGEDSPQWIATNGSGAVTVDGASSIAPTIDFAPAEYTLTFDERGLRTGAVWWINSSVGGWAPMSATVGEGTAGDSIAIDGLVSGSYPFSAGSNFAWAADPSSGNVSITDGSPAVTVDFSETEFPVVFAASGLAGGGTWSVSLGAANATSAGARIVLWSANGTYAFEVAASNGCPASPSAGSLVVQGSSTSPVPVTLERSCASAGAPGSALPLEVGIGVGAAAALLGGLAAVLLLRRRQGRIP